MKWVLENLGFVIVVAIAAVSFLRGAIRTAKGGQDGPKRPAQMEDPAAAERMRRVQEEIRRKIAERRGAASAASSAPAAERAETREFTPPPLLRPAPVHPVDPFGGPMRRIAEALEEAAQRRFEDPEETAQREELERRQKLEAQMRALEAARAAEEQRAQAAAAAVMRRTMPATAVLEFPDATGVREQVRDRNGLRRAIVLTEILGAPVGLRRF